MNMSLVPSLETAEAPPTLGRPVSARGILLSGAIVFFLAVVGGLLAGRPEMLGDTWEYSWVTYSIAEHGSPVIDVRAKEAFARKFPIPEILNENALIRYSRYRYDPPHFWMFSLLASPFYLVCDAIGSTFHFPWFWVRAFLLLHATLLGLTAAVAYAFFGKKGAAIVAVFFVASPVLFYLSKPHAELFTFCWFSLALLFLSKRRFPAAAFCLAMAATQNTPFIPFVLLLIAISVLQNGWQRRFGELELIVTSLLIAFMDPAFYLIRHHVINGHIADGQAGLSNISVRKAVSLFIDPDIGLFANWPLGLILILLALIFHRHFRKVVTQNLPLALFSALFILVMPFCQSMAVNWNSGGTVSISRYATWYLPIFLVWFMVSTAVPLSTHTGWLARGSLIALAFLAVPCIALNMRVNSPSASEKYNLRTALANAMYRRWPGLYDPVPEVFVERALETEAELGPTGNWAAADAACNKLYVPVIPPETPNLSKPAGCKEPLDGTRVVHWLRQNQVLPDTNGYINLREGTLANLLPAYTLGTRLDFATLSTSSYLGRGWSGQEPYGRWSDGHGAEIAFRVTSPPKRGLRTILQIAGNPYSFSGNSCRTSVLLNGVQEGSLDAAHHFPPETYELPLSVSADQDYRLGFRFNGVRESSSNALDPRHLCFYLRSMEIYTMPPTQIVDSLPVYQGEEVIDFSHAANAVFLTSGWSVQEQAGRWSNGSPAIFAFYFHPERDAPADYYLLITGAPIVRNGRAADIEVFVNGRPAGKLDAQHESARDIYRLPLRRLTAGKCEVKLVVDGGHPVQSSGDPRRLGFYIRTIQLERGPNISSGPY